MKNLLVLLARIGLILLAATAVVGITMRFVDTNATNRFTPDQRDESSQANGAVSNADGAGQSAASPQTSGGREFRGERHGPRNQTLASRLTFGLFGFAKNFAIIGVVVLVVVSIERLFARRLHRAAV